MRVVGGSLRGRSLKSPPGRKLRPTSDRIRESIFDLLGPGPPGAKVLDLFAGTGALGIEALSRGCQLGVFVEQDRTALGLIRDNLTACELSDRARVEVRDVFQFLQRLHAAAPFDLVLLDPPYRQDLALRALQQLAADHWTSQQGVVVCEAEKELELPDQIGGLTRTKHKHYGDTSVHVYVVDNSTTDG